MTVGTTQLAPGNGHNYIINGAFDIWQRGAAVSQTTVSNTYTIDRWYTTLNQVTSGTLTTRQNTADKQVTDNYCAEIDATAVVTTSVINLTQLLETMKVVPLRGQTITLSFSAKVSTGTQTLTGFLRDGTDTNGFPITSGTQTNFSFDANTSWQRFTFTHNVQAVANSLAIRFTTPNGFSDKLFISQVQLEAGSVATPFKRNANSIAGELAACQRYYQIYGTQANEFLTTGFCYSTSQSLSTFNFVQEMRVAPTISFSAASDFGLYAVGASSKTVTAIAAGFASTKSFRLQANIGTTDLGAGNATNVFSNSGGGRIEVSAEL